MSASKELKKEYYAARKELEQLEAELPNFEALLHDNLAEEAKAKASKNYHELSLAKTRTQAARELLEQHNSDIETARAEAERLEAEYQAALRLDKMADFAKEATKQKEAFEATMVEANAAMLPLVEKLYNSWRRLIKAQSDFRSTGRSISNGFGLYSWPWGATGEQIQAEEAKIQRTLNEIKERGADVEVVLTPWNGRATVVDRNPKDLARPEPHGPLLWHALFQREEGRFNEAQRALRAEDARRLTARS